MEQKHDDDEANHDRFLNQAMLQRFDGFANQSRSVITGYHSRLPAAASL